MSVILFAIFFAAIFVAAYALLDMIFPANVTFNKVGGLTHWRFGRIGGSVYKSKVRR